MKTITHFLLQHGFIHFWLRLLFLLATASVVGYWLYRSCLFVWFALIGAGRMKKKTNSERNTAANTNTPPKTSGTTGNASNTRTRKPGNLGASGIVLALIAVAGLSISGLSMYRWGKQDGMREGIQEGARSGYAQGYVQGYVQRGREISETKKKQQEQQDMYESMLRLWHQDYVAWKAKNF